jgi:hypothetical protein
MEEFKVARTLTVTLTLVVGARSILTKTIRFMEKVSGTRSSEDSQWKEWSVEADTLRTALLTNKDLHRPKNFREEVIIIISMLTNASQTE